MLVHCRLKVQRNQQILNCHSDCKKDNTYSLQIIISLQKEEKKKAAVSAKIQESDYKASIITSTAQPKLKHLSLFCSVNKKRNYVANWLVKGV